MSHIVAIAGSPSCSAKSSAVLEYALRLIRRQGEHTSAIVVRDLPADDLLHARLDSPAIQSAITLLERAEGVILATPVYKAAYTGILKAFLDILPQNVLQDKVILPIATGGSPSHLRAVDYALKPVLSALGACHILRSVYLSDSQIQFQHGGALELDESPEQRLHEGLSQLVHILRRPHAPEPLLEAFER